MSMHTKGLSGDSKGVEGNSFIPCFPNPVFVFKMVGNDNAEDSKRLYLAVSHAYGSDCIV